MINVHTFQNGYYPTTKLNEYLYKKETALCDILYVRKSQIKLYVGR